MTFWTAERVQMLGEMFDERLTYDKIGERLGCTKNAALGKARRLGFDERVVRVKPKAVVSEPRRDPFPASTSLCCYPHGHPGTPDFHFCQAKVPRVGVPYCDTHMALCYIGKGAKLHE